ncbi:MAG: helix-turn-helix transcriptional regulator [Thermoleophilia bacterium]|nr:helix-turn-helix transcriptional regulator [Thermoleophilia bacterium]
MSLPWSTRPFGDALRDALEAQGMSFRDLESRCLVPVGNLHDHVSGKRGVPGDDLMARIAGGLRVEPDHFREWRLRRLEEALIADPEMELWLSRRRLAGTLPTVRPAARRRAPDGG